MARIFGAVVTLLLWFSVLGSISSLAVGRPRIAFFNTLCGLLVWFIHIPLYERMLLNEQKIKKLDEEAEGLRKKMEEKDDE